MNWYLVKIVFRITCGEGHHRPQFDEQLRVIAADDEHHAYDKAKTLGLHEEDTFLNNQKKLVQWRFVDVPEIFPLNEIMDGSEMYSRIQEPENEDRYTELIHKKAAEFQTKKLPELFQMLREAMLLF